jgi:phage gp37-like protein
LAAQGVRQVIASLIVTLMFVHALIAICMAWIGLTDNRANAGIVVTWFGISIFTVVALGQALP